MIILVAYLAGLLTLPALLGIFMVLLNKGLTGKYFGH